MNWTEIALPIAKNIVFALIVLIFGWIVIKAFNNFIQKHLEKSKLDSSLKSFLLSLTDTVLKILLVLTIINILGIPMTTFAAIFGAAALAVGLAFQGSLSNFAGGVLLLTTRPFKVGDYIDGAGFSGTVRAIQILYTELVTDDNKVIFIPNGSLSNTGITNHSLNPTRRLEFKFEFPKEKDTAHVIQLLNEIVRNHPSVLQDPEPFVRLSKHGASVMEYTIRIWVDKNDYWNVNYDILEQVKNKIDEDTLKSEQ